MDFKKILSLFLVMLALTSNINADCYDDYKILADKANDNKKYKESIAFYEKSLSCTNKKNKTVRILASLVAAEYSNGDSRKSKIYLEELLRISPKNKWAIDFRKRNFSNSINNNKFEKTVKYYSGNVKVIHENDEEKLYVNNQKTRISDKLVSVYRIIPSPKTYKALYLVETDGGGSGTFPVYYFLSIIGQNQYQLSKDIYSGGLVSLTSANDVVTIVMDAIYNDTDNSLIQSKATLVFKDGKLF